MSSKNLLLFTLMGIVAGASFYWRDYNNIESGTLFLIGLAIPTFIVTVLAGLWKKSTHISVPSMVLLGILIAFILRLFFDSFISAGDLPAHNLLPLEMIVGAIICIPAAATGIGVVYVIHRLKSTAVSN
jgi:energy-coupling factor transporter transmembrane protein EcfT